MANEILYSLSSPTPHILYVSRDSKILPQRFSSAIVWGNLPPRNTLIMRASNKIRALDPRILQTSSRTIMLENEACQLISSLSNRKAWRRASFISGGRAGGCAAESCHVPSQGRLLVPCAIPAFSIFAKPADATPGEMRPGRWLSGVFALCRLTYLYSE